MITLSKPPPSVTRVRIPHPEFFSSDTPPQVPPEPLSCPHWRQSEPISEFGLRKFGVCHSGLALAHPFFVLFVSVVINLPLCIPLDRCVIGRVIPDSPTALSSVPASLTTVLPDSAFSSVLASVRSGAALHCRCRNSLAQRAIP